jgi:hypothetical protein
MRSKVFAFVSAALLLLNMAAFAAVDTHNRKAKKRQTNPLVALLPASDAVATLDSKRLISEAMPQILSANQPMLDRIMGQVNDIESKTGIDLKKFDSVVIGMSVSKVGPKNFKFDPVAIARGDVKSGTLLAVAKLAANGAYREEKYGERTIYIFTAKEVIKKTTAKTGKADIESMIGDTLDGLTQEIAVSALDANTLVFGSLARVQQTLGGKSHISPEVTALLPVTETAVIAFGMRTPDGMSSLMPLENDELGKNIDSIRSLSGSMEVTAAGTTMQMSAKTAKAEQAKSLYDTLDGLKMLGKAFLGGSKRADQRIYARLIESAKIDVRGNVVTLDLLVPQADIDTLIGAVK